MSAPATPAGLPCRRGMSRWYSWDFPISGRYSAIQVRRPRPWQAGFSFLDGRQDGDELLNLFVVVRVFPGRHALIGPTFLDDLDRGVAPFILVTQLQATQVALADGTDAVDAVAMRTGVVEARTAFNQIRHSGRCGGRCSRRYGWGGYGGLCDHGRGSGLGCQGRGS